MPTSFNHNSPTAPKWRGRSFVPEPQLRNHSLTLAKTTGPLTGLIGRNALALLDIENLTIAAREIGYELNYAELGRQLSTNVRTIQLHAALSVDEGDSVDSAHMNEAGFNVHTRVIGRLSDGSKSANADNVFAFQAGLLVSRTRADVVILGSGDGQLVCDVASAIRDLPTRRLVYTLSIPGATSGRLDSRRNSSIDTNLEVGLDVLSALGSARRHYAS